MSRFRLLVPGLFLFSFTLGISMHVHAEPTRAEQAEMLFQEGFSLFKRDAYEEALVKFRASFVLERSPGVWANIIFCLEPLGRDVEAIAEYDALVEAYGESVSAESRAQLEPYLLELGHKLGFGLLTITTPGIGVSFLDGKSIGAIPRKMPLRVLSGEHVLRVELPETVPLEQRVVVGAGKLVQLSLAPWKRVPMEFSASLLVGNSLGTNLENVYGTPQWRVRGFGLDVRYPVMFGQTWGMDLGLGYLQAHGQTAHTEFTPAGKQTPTMYRFDSEQLGLYGAVLHVGGRAKVVVSPASYFLFRMGIGSFVGGYREDAVGGIWTRGGKEPKQEAASIQDETKLMAMPLLFAEIGFSRQMGPFSLGASLGVHYAPFGGTWMSAPKGSSLGVEDSLLLSTNDAERGRRVESLLLVYPGLSVGLRL